MPNAKPQTQPLDHPDALLPLKTVVALTALSEATLRRKAATDPSFPKLVRLSSHCVRVRAGDLSAWLNAKAAA